MPELVRVMNPGSVSIPNAVCRLTSISSDAKLLYGVICNCAAANIDPDFERMAAWIGMPDGDVGPILDELHGEGLLDVQIMDGYDAIRLTSHPCFEAQEVNVEEL